MDLPSGTVTFLFTDLEGSTRLWQEHPDAMQGALARHDELVRAAIEGHRGHVVKTTGDGFHAVFATSRDALLGAVAAMRAIEDADWGEVGAFRVRMGLHTGEADQRDGDYYGPSLNRAARLMSAAHGGQLVCSQTTADLVRDELPADIALVDLGDVRLRDLERAERVFAVQVEGLQADFPPLRSLDEYPGNLPSQLTSFVGREQMLQQIVDDLVSAPIVTLTGTGGVGKTRLALQVCAEVLPHYPDGGWFVDLAPVRDGDQVVHAVATVLGVKERVGEPLVTTLRDHLRERRAVVLLDNCEHVIDHVCAMVTDLCSRPLAARLVATTREPMGIDGERVRRVASLSAAEAVALFLQRATSVRSDVGWAGDDADVLAICEQLDGIPLAVELAAARTRSMSPADILRRLDARFRLLAGSRRSARERHQTLLATVEWSYDLLTEAEQTLFDRLAVFRGTFSLDAAEVVCAGGAVDELDVVDLLERLVDKSMVLPIESRRGSRFRLLETLRQFAESKLAARGESDEYRGRHVDHFLSFALSEGPRTRTTEQREVLALLMAERPNINAMLDRLVDDGSWAEVAKACRALGGFWSTFSPEDGRRWCVLVEPHVDQLRVPERVRFLAFSSYVLINSGFPTDAVRHGHAAVAEADAAGLDPPPDPYFALAWEARMRGALDESLALAERGRDLARSAGQPWNELVIRMQGQSVLAYLDIDAALAEASELVAFADELGVPVFQAAARFGQATACAKAGDREACERALADAADLAKGTAIHIQMVTLLLTGLLQIGDGDPGAMETLLQAIEVGERHAVMPEELATAYDGVASLWLGRGRADDAAILFAAANGMRESVGAGADPFWAEVRTSVHDELDVRLALGDRSRLAALGRGMSRDEIRRFALGEYDPRGSS